MTLQEKNKAIVTRFNKEVIEQGNLQVFEELVATDFVNQSAFTLGIPAGRDGIKDYLLNVLRTALTDIKVDIYEQFAEGDTVVTRKAIRGTQVGEFMGNAPNHQRLTMHLIDIVKLKNGQYSEHWRYGQVINIE